MATQEDVESFLSEFAPASHAGLQPEAKEELRGLIEYYESYEYTKEQLAEAIDERVEGPLESASADDVATAVAELNQPEDEAASDKYGDEYAEELPDAHAADEQRSDGVDQMYEDLAAALAEDANAEIEATKEEFFAYLTEQLWADVRVEIAAELAESADEWDSVEQAKAAAYEPAYEALMEAIEGLFEAGSEEGGFAALLSRPKS